MKLKYRAEIDGLRAISVCAVILYHAQITIFGHQLFKGGFIGVDIFFVISGYLITSIILKELVTTGSFSFKYFYERRIRRILPIYLLVGFVVIFICYLILPHKIFNFNFSSFLSSLPFLSNYFFYNEALQYSAVGNTDILLLHTWSLSVEEQFYLIFPFLFLFLFRKLNYRTIFVFIFISGIILSTYLSIIKPSFSFFSLPTRFFELLFGTLICLFEKDIKEKFEKYSKIFSLIGLILIIISILCFSHDTLHPSYITLLPLFGASLIIIFSTFRDYVTKILSSKLFVFTGLISYSLYLWHYPIFLIVKYLNLVEGLIYKKILLFLFIFIISYLSYKFIEKPFRKIYSFKKVLSFIFSLIFLSLIIGYIANNHKNLLYQSSIFLPQDINNSIYLDDEIWHMLRDKEGKECFDRNKDFCIVNDTSDSSKTVLLVGSSVAASYAYNLAYDLDKENKFIPMTAGGCMFIEDYIKVYENKEYRALCDEEYMKNVQKIIDKNQPSYIVYAGSFILDAGSGTWFLKKFSSEFNDALLVKDFKKHLYNLLDNNIVILIYPYPDSPYTDPLKKIHLNELKSKFFGKKNSYLPIDVDAYYKSFNRAREIRIYDSIVHKNLVRVKPLDIICKQTNDCSSVAAGKYLFSNEDHPTYYGSSLITDEIIRVIKSTKLPSN